MEFMGHADLPQQAKHNASVQALPYLHQMPDIKPPAKAAAIPKSSQSKEATEAASMTKEGKNVIMVLNEIAMQQYVLIYFLRRPSSAELCSSKKPRWWTPGSNKHLYGIINIILV